MKKLISIFLAILMLTMNVGVTMATHYCGGIAAKTKFLMIPEGLSCGMEEVYSSCDKHTSDSSIQSKSCCENQYVHFELDEDYNSQVISELPMNFLAAFAICMISLYSLDVSIDVEYLNYSPPLLDLDLPVLVQSFLL